MNATPPPLVVLNTTNHLALRGPVTAESVDSLAHRAMSLPSPPRYLYLDTPGGEVLAGQRLIELVVQLHLTCLVLRAHSMGFAVLQHCARRLALRGATLMQHHIAVSGLSGPVGQIDGYLAMVRRLGSRLAAAQAARLGVSREWFVNRTRDEWWLEAEGALASGAIDGTVTLWCTATLTQKNVSLPPRGGAGALLPAAPARYSACPLVGGPLPQHP